MQFLDFVFISPHHLNTTMKEKIAIFFNFEFHKQKIETEIRCASIAF